MQKTVSPNFHEEQARKGHAPGKLQNVIYSVIFFHCHFPYVPGILPTWRLQTQDNQSIKQREINFRMIYVIACHIFTMYVF